VKKPSVFLNCLIVFIISVTVLFINGCARKIVSFTDLSQNSQQQIVFVMTKIGLKKEFQFNPVYKENFSNNTRWITLSCEYRIPPNLDWNTTLAEIDRFMKLNNYQVVVKNIDKAPPENIAVVSISKNNLCIMECTIRQKIIARIAFVIDDLGHNTHALYYATQINRPITYAVLPNMLKSKKLAEIFSRRGDIIILHQPMMSNHGYDPGPGAILPDMTRDQIIETIRKNFEAVPNVRGMNNHMGSLITTNPDKMRVILQYLRERNAFFLDSFTSKSVSIKVARDLQFPVYKRDVFIDNTHDRSAIYHQIDKLCNKAVSKSHAIGIGHFYPLTMQCILEKIPDIERQGIKLVYVCELPREQ